jgi:hypothetical protein
MSNYRQQQEQDEQQQLLNCEFMENENECGNNDFREVWNWEVNKLKESEPVRDIVNSMH